MRTDAIYLGSGPAFEATARISDACYRQRATRECQAFIDQLRRQFGDEPDGCNLVIAENPHDAGVYLSVNVQHDRDDLTACNWACKVEANVPLYWDDEASAALGLEPADVNGGGGGGGGS